MEANIIETFKMQKKKKIKKKNGSLKIFHVDFARFMFKMLVLFKSISLEGKQRKTSCGMEVYDFMRFLFYDFTILCMFFINV